MSFTGSLLALSMEHVATEILYARLTSDVDSVQPCGLRGSRLNLVRLSPKDHSYQTMLRPPSVALSPSRPAAVTAAACQACMTEFAVANGGPI